MAADGCNVISEVPSARWEPPEPYWVADIVAKRVRHGGFVNGAELFDNRAFGVSVAEASAMDPQQRVLLEVSYGALHAAGRATLEGNACGVFLAVTRSLLKESSDDRSSRLMLPLGCNPHLNISTSR